MYTDVNGFPLTEGNISLAPRGVDKSLSSDLSRRRNRSDFVIEFRILIDQ